MLTPSMILNLQTRFGGKSEFDDNELDFKEDFEVLNKLDEDWKEYFAEEASNTQYTREDEDSRKHFFDSLKAKPLFNNISWSKQLAELLDEELVAIEYLIGSLDNRGYHE